MIALYRKYALFSLATCVAVIVWGAYVRASGSGAGCGAHWPLCNGVVMPDTDVRRTLVEFSH
ncbi:MAG: COX15/CtaA family protein, partial [Bdellovibrionota bacterium]